MLAPHRSRAEEADEVGPAFSCISHVPWSFKTGKLEFRLGRNNAAEPRKTQRGLELGFRTAWVEAKTGSGVAGRSKFRSAVSPAFGRPDEETILNSNRGGVHPPGGCGTWNWSPRFRRWQITPSSSLRNGRGMVGSRREPTVRVKNQDAPFTFTSLSPLPDPAH